MTGVAFGATDTITATVQGQSFSSSGAYTPAATSTDISSANMGNSLANGAWAYSKVQSGNVFPVAVVGVSATITTPTPAGNVNVFLEYEDSILGWPQAGLGTLITNLNFTAVGTVGPELIEI